MAARSTSWTWRAQTRGGETLELPATEQTFPSQSDAESWLGESWPELVDAGAEQVFLLADGEVVYGPMGLDAG